MSGSNSTSVEGDLTNLNAAQAGAVALNFVQALSNPLMHDRDVFYAGLEAVFATTSISPLTQEAANAAYQRLKKLTAK